MDYDEWDALLHHIFKETQGDAWFKSSEDHVQAGVCLRVDDRTFRLFPYGNRHLQPFEAAIRMLNPVIAVKMHNAAIHAALTIVTDEEDCIYLDYDTRIQIVDTMEYLSGAEKEQSAAFIRDERVMVIWSNDLDNIIATCRDFDEKLLKLVWKHRSAIASLVSSASPSHLTSAVDLVTMPQSATPEKETMVPDCGRSTAAQTMMKSICGIFKRSRTASGDLEKTEGGPTPRPLRLLAPISCGFSVGLTLFLLSGSVGILLQESLLDSYWQRFVLLVAWPFMFCVSIFFTSNIVTNILYLIGPVVQFHENSKYYSAVPPAPNKVVDANLPHITIELPVYKEGLKETIAPSVFSLKKAMQTYARQGGTCSMFVHDDGLQLLNEEERQERISFYANHEIGWVARPPNSAAPDGFKRPGRFRKGSNMNYGLALSLKMEKHLNDLEVAAELKPDEDAYLRIEDSALEMAIEETYNENGRRWRPWAANAKSLRIGEIILLVNSDTIVPEDCLRDAAREFAECPEVAIIQHDSDVLQVAHHYFENGITHFTRRIHRVIGMRCANGEIAPFLGHHAFLRWSALQDAALVDSEDGKSKIWSESNVSEDFDMALRLISRGYIIRWAKYANRGFKEGVSLTCDAEIDRWQKYTYGCNELIFNPIIQWWYKGPIHKQLRIFLWSNAPIHYKFGMMSYAMASTFVLSILNYFILGWGVPIDQFYGRSFEIWMACLVVFPLTGNVCFTILEYRLAIRSLLSAAIENVTWVPFFFIFFGGLSIHLSQAILAHLFSCNVTWGVTKKEVEQSNFWKEVPRILKRFRVALSLSLVTIAGMIVLTTSAVPIDWRIVGWDWAVIMLLAIVVGCHILHPILLNPWLMIFPYREFLGTLIRTL